MSAEKYMIPKTDRAVLVPARVAALVDRELEPLRRRWRGVDQQVGEVLLALHATAELWRAEHEPSVSVCGQPSRPNPDTGALLDTTAAADQLSLSRRQARRLAASGELVGRKVAGSWWFDAAAVAEFGEARSDG